MAYRDEVLADGPFAYWRMGQAAGAEPDEAGGDQPLALTATRDVVGALAASQDDGAAQFNGTSQSGSAALDLSPAMVVAVECWLWWDVNGSNDKMALEFTPNANTTAGGFNVDWNNSTGGAEANTVSVKWFGSSGAYRRWTFPRPAAAAWHHVVVQFDRATATATVYVDGVAQALTVRESVGAAATLGAIAFANSTLYLMSRAGASLFGAGKLDEVAIYKAGLSAARVLAHYNAASTTGTTSLAIAPATESASAQPLSSRKIRLLGTASETATAQGLVAQKRAAIAPAVDGAAAQPVTARKIRTVLAAAEAAAAIALHAMKLQPIAPAGELASAQLLAPLKRRQLTPATEATTIGSAGAVKVRSLVAVIEVDQAGALKLLRAGSSAGRVGRLVSSRAGAIAESRAGALH